MLYTKQEYNMNWKYSDWPTYELTYNFFSDMFMKWIF